MIEQEKKKRVVFIVTEADVFLFQILKNKDKATARASPFAYIIWRRFPISSISEIVFSTLADNFFLIKVTGEYDVLLYNRKKIELISVFKRVKESIRYTFSDNITIALKKNKTYNVNFVQDGTAPEGGLMKKGKTVAAPPGEGRDAYPDIKEPTKVTHVRSEYVPSTTQTSNTAPPKREMPTPGGPPPSRREAPSPGGQPRGPPPARRAPPPA